MVSILEVEEHSKTNTIVKEYFDFALPGV